MNRWTPIYRTAFAAALVAGVAGCSDSVGGNGETELSVRLTDAPGDFHAAVVTISEIYLQGSDGRVVLSTNPTTTDLLTLTNDVATLVDGVMVPEGSYQELRFVITGGYIEVEQDGGGTAIYASSPDYEGLPAGTQVTGSLQMPSFAQSGLKVVMEDGLNVSGDQKVLLVDFDVTQSFGQVAGQSGMWVMHPVITGADFAASGSVSASLVLGESVTLPGTTTLGEFEAVLTNDGGSAETAVLTDGDADGTFETDFLYLLPGDYTVTFNTPAGVTATIEPASIAVSLGSGENESAAAVVTAAE